MAKAKKLPSGSWRVNQYVGKDADGKRIYKSFTADTKKEAEYMAAEYVMHNKFSPGQPNYTLGQAIDNYITLKDQILSPSTIRLYQHIRKTQFQQLMNIKLDRLTQDMIQNEVNKMTKTLSPKTIRNNYSLLYTAVKYYKPGTVYNITLPQPKKKDLYIPTPHEVSRIIDFATGTPMETPIILAAGLGLRKSEILALKWDNIDFINGTVTVDSAIVLGPGHKLYEKAPKSTAGHRTIAAPDLVMDSLRRNKNDSAYVCTVSEPMIYDNFIGILDKLEIPHFRFHDLRHYNASVMLALGVPDKYAMERMGHSTNTMLKSVYQHTMEDKRKEISQNINSFFQSMQHEMQHEKEKPAEISGYKDTPDRNRTYAPGSGGQCSIH